MIRNRSLWLICLTSLTATAGPAPCQEGGQDGFWDAESRRKAAFAAVQMITQPNPYMMFVVRERGRNHNQQNIWHEWNYDPALGVPALNAIWLRQIKDRTALPDVRGRPPQIRGTIESATYNLYCQAVRFAYFVPLEAFEKSARDNAAVTYANLYESKDEHSPYRGEVIPVEGQLRRLRRKDAPKPIADELGVRHIYEGWIEGPTEGAPLFWVVVANPPEDKDDPSGLLQPAEKMDRTVKFYGYFIKLLPYKVEVGSGDNRKMEGLVAPLLIGPKLILTSPATPVRPGEPSNFSPFSSLLLLILGAFGGFAFGIIVVLTWWFRKGDRQFRERLHRFHTSQALDMLENNKHELTHEDHADMKHEAGFPATEEATRPADGTNNGEPRA